jgi:hypothetical protein
MRSPRRVFDRAAIVRGRLRLPSAGAAQARRNFRIDPTLVVFNEVVDSIQHFVISPVFHKQLAYAVQLPVDPQGRLRLLDVADARSARTNELDSGRPRAPRIQ